MWAPRRSSCPFVVLLMYVWRSAWFCVAICASRFVSDILNRLFRFLGQNVYHSFDLYIFHLLPLFDTHCEHVYCPSLLILWKGLCSMVKILVRARKQSEKAFLSNRFFESTRLCRWKEWNSSVSFSLTEWEFMYELYDLYHSSIISEEHAAFLMNSFASIAY